MRVVVPWPPGGSADTIGRILAEHLGNAFAQSVVVENRPGASAEPVSAPMIAAAANSRCTLASLNCTTCSGRLPELI
jgi:tripartite-type tricarboxylate transporter receptor subunit TctC